MVSYYTGSGPIEISDLRSKVKVAVTENVCKIDEKKNVKKSNLNIFKIKSHYSDWKFDNLHFDTKYDHIAQ